MSYIVNVKKNFDSVIFLRIPKEWDEILVKLADQEYLGKSDIVRRAIKEYLDKNQANVSPGRLGAVK